MSNKKNKKNTGYKPIDCQSLEEEVRSIAPMNNPVLSEKSQDRVFQVIGKCKYFDGFLGIEIFNHPSIYLLIYADEVVACFTHPKTVSQVYDYDNKNKIVGHCRCSALGNTLNIKLENGRIINIAKWIIERCFNNVRYTGNVVEYPQDNSNGKTDSEN